MSLSLEAASAGEEGICAIEASKWQHLAASCRSLNCQLDLWFEILPTILICNNNKENKKPQCGHEMLRTDMGNPTVGLVYYTATLHYNCSFKSSLPYIATLL